MCLLGGSSRGALRAPFFSAGPLGAACECNATSGCSPQRLIWAPLWGRETNVQKKLFLLHLAYFGPMQRLNYGEFEDMSRHQNFGATLQIEKAEISKLQLSPFSVDNRKRAFFFVKNSTFSGIKSHEKMAQQSIQAICHHVGTNVGTPKQKLQTPRSSNKSARWRQVTKIDENVTISTPPSGLTIRDKLAK